MVAWKNKMLAERAADIIRERELLSASNVEVGLVARWEESQRPNKAIRQAVKSIL